MQRGFKGLVYLTLSGLFVGVSLLLAGCYDGSNTNANTTITLNTSNYFVNQGSSSQIIITNTGQSTTNNIEISGLPTGVSQNSACSSIAAGQSCTVTLSASSTATTGPSSFTLKGSNTNSVSAILAVAFASGFVPLPGAPNTGTAVSSSVILNNTVYIGTGAGVYQRGSSGWEALNTGLGNLVVSSLVTDTHNNLFAGTATGVYELKSGTSSWIALPTENLTLPNDYLQIAVDRDDYLYAQDLNGSLLSLQPNTSNWLPVAGFSGSPQYLTSNNGYAVVLGVTGATSTIYTLQDGSASAITIGLPTGFDGNTLALDSSGNIYTSATPNTDDTVVWSNGTSAWTTQLSLSGNSISAIFPQNTSTVYVAADGELFSENNDITPAYSVFYSPAITSLSILPSSGTLYVGTDLAMLKGDGTQTGWSMDNTGLSTPISRTLLLSQQGQSAETLSFGISGTNLTPNGAVLNYSYNVNSNTLTNGNLMYNSDIDAYASDTYSILAVGSSYYVGTDVGLFRCANGIGTCSFLSNGATNPPPAFASLASDGASGLYAIDTNSSGTLQHYSGSSWDTTNLPPLPIGATEFSSIFYNNGLYAGTDAGLFKYNPSQNNWSLIATVNDTNPVISVISEDNSNSNFYLAYYNAGDRTDSSNICSVSVSGGTCQPLLTNVNPELLENIYALQFINNTLFIGGVGGLYSWQQGDTAYQLVGLSGLLVYALQVDAQNNLFTTTDGGWFEWPAANQ